ncbi:MAG: hypothetical protein NTW21_25945 [Verrucomicrobia bacterium]|nr:hypothetical protein [Verrucomicrobiota bacterium]
MRYLKRMPIARKEQVKEVIAEVAKGIFHHSNSFFFFFHKSP